MWEVTDFNLLYIKLSKADGNWMYYQLEQYKAIQFSYAVYLYMRQEVEYFSGI
jgi:hypothetical protein